MASAGRPVALVVLTVLAVLAVLATEPAAAMIEPRLSRPQWWQPAGGSVSRQSAAQPPSASGGHVLWATSTASPYLFNRVGPKPPPGYSFSAGPKRPEFPPPPTATSPQPRRSSAVDRSGGKQRPKSDTTRNRGDGRPATDGVAVSCRPLCPAFRLLRRTARYQVRQYPRTLWVSYVTVTENRLLAEMEARAGIAEFLSGHNSHRISLPQTFPYVTQLRYGRMRGMNKKESDFSISVPLLDGIIQPRPDSNQLVVDYVSEQRVFVTSFRARPWKLTDKALRLRAKRFVRRLRRHGHSFLDTYFYLAKYGRHYETHPVLPPSAIPWSCDESRKRSYEIWLYSTPFRSRSRFRPTGKPEMARPTNLTLDTMRRLCRGLECPHFEVLSEHDGGIQKRHYYNAVFATSRMDGCDSSIEAMWRGLMPLHLYRQGINSHLEVIEATRPIGVLRVHQAVPERNITCSMTSLMYLPRRLHRNPPNTGPAAPATSLMYVHSLHVYVATVGGFVLEPGRVQREVASFRHELDELGLCYLADEYLVAVYDFIQRYHGRLNEIWMVARHCRRT